MAKTTVSIVKCNSLDESEVENAVRRAIQLVGGIKTIVKANSEVLIKPNIGTASPREKGMSTDPSVVAALINLAKEAGAKRVMVGESSVVGVDTLTAFKASGILEASEAAGAEVIDFKRNEFVRVPVPASPIRKSIQIAKVALEADVIIDAPKLKTITAELMSVSLKNLKGLIPDSEKKRSHRIGLSQSIIDFNTVVKPALSVVDGIVASEVYQPRPMGVILAGHDLVAVDTVAAHLIGINPQDVIHLKLAAESGLGTADLKKIILKGEDIVNLKTSFKTAPKGVGDLAFPNVTIVDGSPCSGCVGALYSALNRARDAGLLKNLEGTPILVGSNVPISERYSSSITFGNCLRQLSEGIFIEGCPPRASDVVETIKQLPI